MWFASLSQSILIRYAIKKAHENNANILVCHVISQQSLWLAKQAAYFLNDTQKNITKEKTSAALKRMQQQLGALFSNEFKDHPEYADCIEHLLVYHGNVVEKLVEKANQFGCEAIVIGPHHNGFVKRLFSGGTGKKIINQTSKAVFMVSGKQ